MTTISRNEFDHYNCATKGELNRCLKHLGIDEVRIARDTWLTVNSFSDFFTLLINLDKLPLSRQDAYAANIFFTKFWNVPAQHKLTVEVVDS